MKNTLNITTHNGKFHCDEVVAVALLALAFDNKNIKIFRTRDVNAFKNADFLLDVGGIYNPKTNHFDHHQTSYTGSFSTAGMVFDTYGGEFKKDTRIANFIHEIDLHDNGIKKSNHSVINMIDCLNPETLCDENLSMEKFLFAVNLIKIYLKNGITKQIQNVINECLKNLTLKNTKNEILLKKILAESSGKFIIFDKYISNWGSIIHSENTNACYVVWQDDLDKKFSIQTIPKSAEDNFSFNEGNNLNNFFDKQNGVIFVHKNGFFAKIESLEIIKKYIK